MTLVKEITQDPAENSHILRTSERINFKKFSKESRPGNMLQKIAASNSTQVVSGLGSEMVWLLHLRKPGQAEFAFPESVSLEGQW